MASVLVKAEATETRTLLNVRDLTTAFEDEQLRPSAAASPVQSSYELLARDWTNDSGEPGDKYDPELAALFREASSGVQLDPDLMQEFLDKLAARDPAVAAFWSTIQRASTQCCSSSQPTRATPGERRWSSRTSRTRGLATTTASRRLPRASSPSRSRTRSQTGKRRPSAPPSQWPWASSPSSTG